MQFFVELNFQIRFYLSFINIVGFLFKASQKYTVNQTFLSSGIKYEKSIWCIVLISILFFYFLSKNYIFAFLHYTMHTTAMLIYSDLDANF